VLKAGTYTTQQFGPQLTYTVPEGGWINYEDNPGSFTLVPPGVSLGQAENGVNVMLVWQRVYAAAMNCSGKPNLKVDSSPKGLAAYFVHQPAFATSQPRPVTLGGLHGYVLSVRIAPHGGVRCGGGGHRQAPLLSFEPDPQAWIGMGSKSEHMQVYLLGYLGHTLAVIADIDGPHPPSQATDTNIIQHFHFQVS
jgi:hypothetical protein